MSVYVDKFIKQHTEYFSRNRLFIETNNWNASNKYKQELDDLKNQLTQVTKTLEGDELDARQNEITDAITALGKTHQTSKAKLFAQETELTNSILSRLTAFIKTTEKQGDRSLPKAQTFIDETVDIINLFIEKCDLYLDYKMEDINEEVTTTDEIELKGQEIKFQDEVFGKKIKVQDKLDELNIGLSVDNLEVTFFKDEKASLIMREPLLMPEHHEIKDKIESIQVDWNVRNSKQMFINMNKKDIPYWNPSKHFFDQDPVTIQFWTEEYNKIRKGITINGYFVHPWLYFHLNFFRTPIPQKDGSEPPIQPDLRDNEWFFAENLKNCISTENPNFYSKAMLVYGTRRFGKSVILASLAHWRTVTKYNSYGAIVGGNSSDLEALTSKIQTSMGHIERPFKLSSVGKQNWDGTNGGRTSFGIKTDASNSVIFSSLIVSNLEEGNKKSKTQKTAGGAPSVAIYDEIGKYSFLKAYLAALPSFATPYGFKCITVLAGTGGEADLSTDAMDVLSNPELYDLLPMDWDLLENKLDPEQITWKKRKFATFFPGQMAYEKGFIKKEEPFGDFIDNDSEELNKIKIHVTDWTKNDKYLDDKLVEAKKEKGKNAKLVVQQRKVQYPRDPEDCFMSGESNKFPTEAAQKKKKYLLDNQITGEKVTLYRSKTGKIETLDASEKELADFPFGGGFIDSPIVIYERPLPRVEDSYLLYIAGLDDYNLEESDGDSLGSFCIYKRNIMDESSNKVVAMYNARPDPHKTFHEQGLMLMEMYNAKNYMENADTKFKDYLDGFHLSDTWLVQGFDPGSEYVFNTSNRRKYGWQPTEANVKFMMGRLLEYCHEVIEVEDADGNIIVQAGVERIDDIGILNEIIGYKKDGNYDRLRSFGSCLMYDLYLTTQYLSPKVAKPQVDDYSTKPVRKARGGLFPNSGGSFFSR